MSEAAHATRGELSPGEACVKRDERLPSEERGQRDERLGRDPERVTLDERPVSEAERSSREASAN